MLRGGMPACALRSALRGGSPAPRAFLLLCLLPAVTAHAAGSTDRVRWYVVPNVAFDTDDGLGFGARGELALTQPGYHPYRSAYVLHAFFTLRGFQHHRFRFDRTGLGPGGRLRVTLHLAWRQWLNDGYWGVGNGAAVERAYADAFDGDDPRRKRYRYTLYQPFAHVTLRARIHGPWTLFASLNPKYSVIRTYDGSLLQEQRPFGMDGGLAMPLSAGVLYDSRRPEADPQRGLFAEISGRVSGALPHGAGVFGGVLASVRGYQALTSWLVLAGRLMGEWLWGEIPFYEMVHWGGAVPVAGFGGFETLRGVPFGRWRAPGKVILNTEARFRVLSHTLLGRPLYWQIGLFLDAGMVFGAGDDATAPAPELPIHPAGGAGLRAVFQETFVGRLDVGLGLDAVREPDGGESYRPSLGIYVVFDQAF